MTAAQRQVWVIRFGLAQGGIYDYARREWVKQDLSEL